MIWLILGLILFLGMHMAKMYFADQREAFIEKRGEGAWKAVYSVVSLAGLVLLIGGYGQARISDLNISFYETPAWAAHLAIPLMWVALVLLVASQIPAGRIKQAVKHPMILGVKIWAVAHLFANGELASYILFGSFLVWAVLNRISVKRRGDPVFEAVSIRNDIIAGAVGSALFVVVYVWAHLYLFGAAPWPT
ncbi:MAG: NnrU family protein [Pseudomonadota bacterium]